MKGFVFLMSPYLERPNVLVDIKYHFNRGKVVVDDLIFSKKVAICEGFPVCEKDLPDLKKFIRKGCNHCEIYFADEDEHSIWEVI